MYIHVLLYTGEFKLNGMFLVIFIVCYCAIEITLNGKRNMHLRLIMTNLSSCCICYAFSFASTYWVIRKYNKQLVSMEPSASEPAGSPRGNTKLASTFNHVRLESILASKDGFDLFANHLVNEFSTENLFLSLK